VLPWYFAACSYGGDAFCHELVLKHNFGMFFDTWSHAQPFYYYLLHAPIVFLPWTLLLPAAVRGMSRDAETRFLLVWVAFAFAFFSVSEAKQAKYLLPLLPPLAILVGRWAAEAQPKPSRELLVAALALLVALSAATIAALLVLPERLPGTTRAAVAGVLPALALLGAAAAHWKRRPAAVALIAASVLVTALAAQLSLVPALEDYKSPRTLVDAAAALGHPVAIHGIAYRQTGGLVFYSGGPLPLLESSEAFHEYMAAPEPRLAYVSRKAFRGEYPVIIDSPYRDGTVLVRNWAEEEP
jgi:4-amino-4-deoxy-L-arabinose transferase-like glycosyltransferase